MHSSIHQIEGFDSFTRYDKGEVDYIFTSLEYPKP